MNLFNSLHRGLLAATASCALVAGAHAAGPLGYALLKDLDATVGSQGSEPTDFVTWNGRVWFSAVTRETGRELFVTDGSATGTRVALDLVPGPGSSGARPLGLAGGRLIIEADDGRIGTQLWAWGGEGTSPEPITMLSLVNPQFRRLDTAGDRLVLTASIDGPFWVSDGTAAGTRTLKNVLTYYQQYNYWPPQPACAANGVATFLARDSAGRPRLVRSDGTAAGTYPLLQLDDLWPTGAVVDQRLINGECHFLVKSSDGDSWGWWATDGATAGTRRITATTGARALGLAAAGGAPYAAHLRNGRFQLLRHLPGASQLETTLDLPAGDARKPVSVANRIAFVADYQSDGSTRHGGVFLGDGTTGGTARVYPTLPSQPELAVDPVAMNSSILIQGDDTGMRIDGATGAASIAPGRLTFDLAAAVPLGAARIGTGNASGGSEPWTSDGSAGGTRMIVDLRPGTKDGFALPAGSGDPPKRLSSANGDTLYFLSDSDAGTSYRYGLWRTDGSEAGTRKLPETLLHEETADQPVALDDGVVFVDRARFALRGRLVRATSMLDAVTTLSPTGSATTPLPSGAGVLYFNADDLYASDAQSPGQFLWPGFGAADTRSIGRIGGAAVFFGGATRGVWRSDGTSPGTFRLAADDGQRPSDEDAPSAVFQGKLYFVACTAAKICALAATDGTVAGTATLRALPSVGSAYPLRQGAFAVAGARLVFLVHGTQLWSSDGTPGGTDLLLSLPAASTTSRLAVAGGKAHLAFECSQQCKFSYVVTDGTPGGTRYVDAPPGLVPTSAVMASVGGEDIVFSCRTPATGNEVCRADADGRNLRLLSDTYPGPAGSNPRLVGVTANAVYLRADDGLHGYEPWIATHLPERIFASGFEPAAE